MDKNLEKFTSLYKKVKSDITQIQKEYNESLISNSSGYLKENLEYFKILNSDGKLIRGFLIALGYKMLKDNIASYADESVYINMNDKCESLNVGVATSIILYKFSK